MSEVQRTFSLTTVVGTTLISFLISGVGGAFVQRYLARGKPVVVVTSAGFEGAADYIEIPDELLTTTQEDAWGTSFSKYEKYSTLRDREAKAAEIEARLTKAIASVESWLKDSERGPEQTSPAEVLRHPLVTDTMFGSSLNGYIRRTELPPPPVSNVADKANLFPIFRRDGMPEMHTGKIGVTFPTRGFVDSRMNEANVLSADSFAKGMRVNIVHYSKVFLEKERQSALLVKKLRTQLQKILLEQARPTVSITVNNSGDTSVALRPYFGMSVLGSDAKKQTDQYLMVLADDPAKHASSDLLGTLLSDKDERDKSKQVKVDPYLPQVGGLAYTTVSPGTSVTLRLVATERLGTKGLQYRTAYESGLLNTKILALTAAGASVWSEVSAFGANVNKAAEADLLGRLK